MPDSSYLSSRQLPSNYQLWQSKAKDAVLDTLRKSQYLTFQGWRRQWQDLHALYDGEFRSIIADRIKVTHPERSEEWLKSDSGLRYVNLVRAWVERLGIIFHSAPETYLSRNGEPLPEDDPQQQQWRKDCKEIEIHQTLTQIEAWTNLMGQAVVQPSWVKGSQMRWLVHAPYEVTIEQDPELPDEIEGAYVSVAVRQPLDTIGAAQQPIHVTWRKDDDQWRMWVHRGETLLENSLFPDNVSRYSRSGSGHPFVMFRKEKPASGLFWAPPDEALLSMAISACVKQMDVDWLLKYQIHAQGVLTGQTLDNAPVLGPSRLLEFPDRDGSLEYVSPSPNMAEFRESWAFELRLAAVAAGMSPSTFEPNSSTRNLGAMQLENYQLKIKRQRVIPAYQAALSKLWESHRMVSNYWAQQTGTRKTYDDDIELVVNIAPIPEVFDRFQDTQATIQELNNSMTSPVEVVMRREGVGREEAKRRVGLRTKDTIETKKTAMQESGATEQVVEVSTEAVLNGPQVVAAAGIVEKVAMGMMPRDAGLGMIEILFNLTNDQAVRIMGSAGTSDYTPPSDTADDVQKVSLPSQDDEVEQPATKAAAGQGVRRPSSVQS